MSNYYYINKKLTRNKYTDKYLFNAENVTDPTNTYTDISDFITKTYSEIDILNNTFNDKKDNKTLLNVENIQINKDLTNINVPTSIISTFTNFDDIFSQIVKIQNDIDKLTKISNSLYTSLYNNALTDTDIIVTQNVNTVNVKYIDRSLKTSSEFPIEINISEKNINKNDIYYIKKIIISGDDTINIGKINQYSRGNNNSWELIVETYDNVNIPLTDIISLEFNSSYNYSTSSNNKNFKITFVVNGNNNEFGENGKNIDININYNLETSVPTDFIVEYALYADNLVGYGEFTSTKSYIGLTNNIKYTKLELNPKINTTDEVTYTYSWVENANNLILDAESNKIEFINDPQSEGNMPGDNHLRIYADNRDRNWSLNIDMNINVPQGAKTTTTTVTSPNIPSPTGVIGPTGITGPVNPTQTIYHSDNKFEQVDNKIILRTNNPLYCIKDQNNNYKTINQDPLEITLKLSDNSAVPQNFNINDITLNITNSEILSESNTTTITTGNKEIIYTIPVNSDIDLTYDNLITIGVFNNLPTGIWYPEENLSREFDDNTGIEIGGYVEIWANIEETNQQSDDNNTSTETHQQTDDEATTSTTTNTSTE